MSCSPSSGTIFSPESGEILHKGNCIIKTLIVKIGVFSFGVQFLFKKAAKPSCNFGPILLQCVHPEILP